ncbi:MAG: S-adenosylmethionine decarboxylase [Nitrospinae bacterium]|nr:S-adenosylmethionine decarboxylase [Nitrospinota bacterium]
MKPYGPAYAFRFGEGIEEGISAFQLIYTSNIAIHTNDMGRDLYMDVFSCKDFDAEAIIHFLKERMEPTEVNYEVLYRE